MSPPHIYPLWFEINYIILLLSYEILTITFQTWWYGFTWYFSSVFGYWCKNPSFIIKCWLIQFCINLLLLGIIKKGICFSFLFFALSFFFSPFVLKWSLIHWTFLLSIYSWKIWCFLTDYIEVYNISNDFWAIFLHNFQILIRG